MNKQIEEMLKDIRSAEMEYLLAMVTADIDDAIDGAMPIEERIATALCEKGYHKTAIGNWVDVYNGRYANQLYKCSVCGNPAYGDGKIWLLTKFCPSCGADMRGEVQ